MSDITKFNSQLQVSQTVTLDASLDVSGTATFKDQFAIDASGDTVSIHASGVSITGTTTITGGFNVSGTVTITGGVGITGTVTITGQTSVGSLIVGEGAVLSTILVKAEQIYFGNIAGNSVGTASVTLTGVSGSAFNTLLIDTPDILNDAFIANGNINTDNVVSLKLHNTSNATVEAITATFDMVVFQF
jgi:hypothetical protein